MADFLELQRRLWYAVYDVPPDCRHAFAGRKKLKKSLGTDSRREALRRVRPIVESWKAIAEKARGGGDQLAARAAFMRGLLEQAADEDERQVIRDHIADIADDMNPRHPDDADVDDRPDGSRFYGLATGALAELAPLVTQWQASRQVAQKTKDMDASTLALLQKRHRTVQEVDRKAAVAFVDKVLMPSSSPATVQRKLSGISTFWKWLQNRGDFAEAKRIPWAGLSPAKPKSKGEYATDKEDRRPFTEDEGAAFLAAVQATATKHPADYVVAMVMAVTGARLEEVCGLTQADLRLDDDAMWMTIRLGKTASASRCIPIVAAPVVAAMTARLKATTSPVFPELEVDRYGKRSSALSKRLGRLLRLAVDDPRVVAAHGWRHRGVTLAEQNGINSDTAKWFFGHARSGEGLRTYSKGPSPTDLISVAVAIPLPLGRP